MTSANAPIEHNLNDSLFVLLGDFLEYGFLAEVRPVVRAQPVVWCELATRSSNWRVGDWSNVMRKAKPHQFQLCALGIELYLIDHRFDLTITQ